MIKPQDFIHPEDEEALRNMEAIPGFPIMVKAFLKIGLEQYYHGLNMASKIRLTEQQLPEIYSRLPPLCKKLNIEEPEFYLELNPTPNAYTFGDTKIFLTVTSGLIESLTDEEISTAIAHECGHIACHHVLYHTMANLLCLGGEYIDLFGTMTTPIRLALLYWYRRSELSADRAAAATLGKAEPVIRTMFRLSGGTKRIIEKVDLKEYAAQAQKYDMLKESFWDKMLQTAAIATQTHPFAAVRVREIQHWCETEQFYSLVENMEIQEQGKLCINCHSVINKSWQYCMHCGINLENN